jgi:hypothetical protein
LLRLNVSSWERWLRMAELYVQSGKCVQSMQYACCAALVLRAAHPNIQECGFWIAWYLFNKSRPLTLRTMLQRPLAGRAGAQIRPDICRNFFSAEVGGFVPCTDGAR